MGFAVLITKNPPCTPQPPEPPHTHTLCQPWWSWLGARTAGNGSPYLPAWDGQPIGKDGGRTREERKTNRFSTTDSSAAANERIVRDRKPFINRLPSHEKRLPRKFVTLLWSEQSCRSWSAVIIVSPLRVSSHNLTTKLWSLSTLRLCSCSWEKPHSPSTPSEAKRYILSLRWVPVFVGPKCL